LQDLTARVVFELSRNLRATIYLNNKAGGVHLGILQSNGTDGALAACVGHAEINKEDLVFVVVDDFVQLRFELNFLCPGEVALEYGELQMDAVAFANLENSAQTLGVADIVSNEKVSSHGFPIAKMCGIICRVGNHPALRAPLLSEQEGSLK
jgi:hypothetical protein